MPRISPVFVNVVIPGHLSRDAKVRKLGEEIQARVEDHHVLRLDVAVYDPQRVRRAEAEQSCSPIRQTQS